MAGPIDGRRLLDAGCRDGIYAVEAARRGAQASGVDNSEAMLRVARRRAADAGASVDLHRADLQEIPFTDDTFDVVMAITALRRRRDPVACPRNVGGMRSLSRGHRVQPERLLR
jgi:ubiquinone/menaquinone biosynthesis C-methylase UbiE